ncbi:hypothetical protein PACTADRAFT_49091 [Pachysolen tannophilus NRRL Y-2460]|uniref:Nitrogen permease regulator 3 n=1 Tax=Pachysolen tannophilus NRRL Y-2460 TaxID=669874 RepID=A0A1E4U046_PACTA|nr:hypothetical protein PACTADRAFT_49091 [Pachysolen tannophilus NRRL Y-2460]
MSLYLPNPCLLGILFTISTHDGPQLAFHYPPRPNEYGYKATPLAQQKDYLKTTGAVESSSSSSEDEDYEEGDSGLDADDGEDDATVSSSANQSSLDFTSGSHRTNSFNSHQASNYNDQNYLSGKALLDILDEQDRKRKRKESKKTKLIKNIMNRNMESTLANHSDTNTNNSSDITAVNDNISSGEAQKTIHQGLNSAKSNSGGITTSEGADNVSRVSRTTSHATNNRSNLPINGLRSLKKVFGFETDFLSEMVTPPKKLCNTRFELTIDDMSFLGLPIHVYDNGRWRLVKSRKKYSSRRSRKSGNSRKSAGSENDRAKEIKGNGDENNDINNHVEDDTKHIETNEEDEGKEQQSDNNMSTREDIDSNDEANDNYEVKTYIKEDDEKCPMNMFHIVFVMNPPVVEYNHRVDEMYHFVASRLSLVLRYEQDKTNFVYEEAHKIMMLKEQNQDQLSINELWSLIIEKSSLANIIYQTFKSISTSEIVNVDINGKIRSFQIPIRNEFQSLPPLTVPVLPGSYISSINPFFKNSNIEHRQDAIDNESDNDMVKFFALLLLDDPETIIKDIQADNDSIIANFIRLIKPTENLVKLSAISGLELSQVLSFCHHLVYWRRAIAVPPLHTRNVYVISPMASIKSLYKDADDFKQEFPSLPSLPAFLSLLSHQHSKTRPYSSIVPSRDHRDLYLDALAWLIRSGWVIQLHTFLWLKITNNIKIAVDEEIEIENFKKAMDKNKNNGTNKVNNSNNNSNNNNNNDNINNKNGILDNPIADNKNNIADKNIDNLITDNSANINEQKKKTQSTNTKNNQRIIIREEEDTILLDPARATALERRWISKIVQNKSPEVTALFYKLLKYFNGRNALEMILAKENISRQDFKKLLLNIEDYVVTVKHW